MKKRTVDTYKLIFRKKITLRKIKVNFLTYLGFSNIIRVNEG